MTLLFAAFATLLSITVSATSEWPTLRKELQKHGLDAASFDDADRRITSYAVKSDDSWFAIAYEHTFLENAGNR